MWGAIAVWDVGMRSLVGDVGSAIACWGCWECDRLLGMWGCDHFSDKITTYL
jgi:hypothetical protein